MKTFVYVADKKNPNNLDGLRIGWVVDERNDGPYTLYVELAGLIISTEAVIEIDSNGVTYLHLKNNGHYVSCRLVTEQFPVPEAENQSSL